MIINPYDVCIVQNYELHKSKYDRTTITIAIVGDDLRVFPTSSSRRLCEQTYGLFMISEFDPDFEATGLEYTSWVLDEPAIIERKRVIDVVGKLRGDLRRRFIEFFGL